MAHFSKQIPFRVGDRVKLELDWKHRYNAMRLHSALHLLAGVFDSKFKERAVAGVVKSNSAYLVFKHELLDNIINRAIEQANKDIKKGLKFKHIGTKIEKVSDGAKSMGIHQFLAVVYMLKMRVKLEKSI